MESKEKKSCECEECTCENNSCECEECTCENNSCECEGCTCECEKHECDENCCSEHSECKKEHSCEEHSKKEKHENKKVKKLEHEIEELEAKLKEAENKVLLAKADSINYRKRKDEEVTRILKFSNEDIVTEMLPVIDNFESAIKMDDDNLEDEVSKFLSGFKMIYCNLVTILEKFDVKAIDGANKPFDPTYHQAVMTEKCDMEPGMVIEVLRKGYILKDKVIRPAMVKVSE